MMHSTFYVFTSSGAESQLDLINSRRWEIIRDDLVILDIWIFHWICWMLLQQPPRVFVPTKSNLLIVY